MNARIKLLLSSAILAVCGSAMGQTVITGKLDANSPKFHRPRSVAQAGSCFLSTLGTNFYYATHTINHPGGNLELTLMARGGTNDAYLGLYNAALDPQSPCLNAIAYDDDSGPSLDSYLNLPLPPGRYTVVATTYDSNVTANYTLTSSAPAAAPHAVPVAGLPALALTSVGLLGAAGWTTRRRKAERKRSSDLT